MKYKAALLFCIFTLGLMASLSISTPAQLDTTFGTNGVASLHVDASNVPVNSFLLPNGKILILNQGARQPNQFTKYYFVRMNADGTPDTTYGTDGVVQLPFPIFVNANLFSINAAIRQTDGKIVIAGTADNDALIMRFTEEGTLDSTFGKGGTIRPNIDQTAPDQVRGVVQQADGKLVVAGSIIKPAPLPGKLFLIRFNANGSYDTTFGSQSGYIVHPAAFPYIGGVALQSSGKILTTPQRERESDGSFRPGAIYRFHDNGIFDESFKPVYYSEGVFKSFHLLSDNGFAVAENENKSDHLFRVHTDLVVSRFSAEGEPDSTFGATGRASVDVTSSMPDISLSLTSLPDGRIILSAITDIEPNRSTVKGSTLSVVRLNPNGSLNGKNLVTNLAGYANAADYPGSVIVQPDGKILIVCTKFIGESATDLILTRSLNIPLEVIRLKGAPFEFYRPSLFSIGSANATVFRPVERKWYVNPLDFGAYFGLIGDIPIPADFIGDFRTDITMFRPETGTWYVAKNLANSAEEFVAVKWGKMGDIPIPRDYDGDSKSDIAVFRPSDGNWYIRNSADGSHRTVRWGMDGDKPVAGDYDGDGFDDIAVWRSSDATWYILKSSDGEAAFIRFGLPGDIPIPEDYDGDGKMDIGVYRPSTGAWYIYESSDGGLNTYNWGRTGDIPIPADYDGDKKMDIGVWRSDDRTWYILQSNDNAPIQYPFGVSSDIPVQGRY